VLFAYCSSVPSGRGALENTVGDPPSFHVTSLDLGREFSRYAPWRRLVQEQEYGRRLVQEVKSIQPHLVLSSNGSLLSQKRLLSECARSRARFVFWLQDVLSVAIRNAMAERVPVLGSLIGESFHRFERSLLMRSDAVIAISEDFRPILAEWGISPRRIHVIENWAPLEEIPCRPRVNQWALRHGLVGGRTILYAGTLGLKHNPNLLLQLALRFRSDDAVRIVVVSEGLGSEWLKERRDEYKLPNLVLLPFQPYADLPDVLATGDILVVILERDAGVFSVPSKVLSYLCAGRPLLAAVPESNLAARVIQGSGAGLLVEPDDVAGFVEAAVALLARPDLRRTLGQRARRYARDSFDITKIGDRFEGLFKELVCV
jgi:colanic acid biosynthesis glycosyl transferase WcaI